MKQAILRIVDGSLKSQGFKVILDIQDTLNVPNLNHPIFSSPIHIEGKLPLNSELANYLLQFWEKEYRPLYPVRAIEPERTTVRELRPQLIKNCRQSAAHLICLFNEWLNSDSFKKICHCLIRELKQTDAIQFLICTNDSQIQKLPWNEWSLIKEDFPHAEVAISPPEYKLFKSLKTRNSRMRVLAILGDSTGINTNKDLQELKGLPNIDLYPLVEPARKEINDRLWQQPWDIIFFAGHGHTEGDEGRIYINSNEYLTIEELEYALREALRRGLKLAIFNSCDGLGLVRQLNERQIYVPQVIVMRDSIPDEVAQKFLKHFLEAFSKKNKPFHLAVREAREQLQGLEDREPCATWLPIVYQHPATVPLTWRQQRDSLSHVFKISIVAAISIIAIRSLGLLEGMELKAYDHLTRLRPPEEPDPRLLLVLVTDREIRPDQQESLSNQDLDKVLHNLSKYEPRFIGLDIYRQFPAEKTQKSLISYLEQNRLIAICQQESEEFGEIPSFLDNNKQQVPSMIGFSDVVVDNDGVIRRQLLDLERPAEGKKCVANNSFSFLIAQLYLANEKKPILFKWDKEKQIRLQVGEKSYWPLLKEDSGSYHQIDAQGSQIILNYRASSEIARSVTLTQVLNNEIKQDWVEDKIVLIGTDAPNYKDPRGARDFHGTPYAPNGKTAGVKIQAHAISQILSAVLDGRAILWWWPFWAEGFWIWIWSSVAGLSCWYFRSLRTSVLAGVATLLLLLGCCYGILLGGGWIPLVPPALAVIGTIVFYLVTKFVPRSLY